MSFGGIDTAKIRLSLTSTMPEGQVAALTDDEVINSVKWVPNTSYVYWSTDITGYTFGQTELQPSVRHATF